MLGKILRKLRISADQKQREVAAAVYVSPSAISQYENGRSQPSRTTLEALANHFNVSTDYLLGTSANPELEETLNRNYCSGISVSDLLDKCMHIPADKRHAFLVVVDALSCTKSGDGNK